MWITIPCLIACSYMLSGLVVQFAMHLCMTAAQNLSGVAA